MARDEWVSVKPFNLLGRDERGTTADFSLPRKQQDFIFITRLANSISGHSYHEGKHEGTKPKVFALLTGAICFEYRHIGSELKRKLDITAPALIEVQPQVVHSIHAVTDISMLECNSIADIQDDRIKEVV